MGVSYEQGTPVRNGEVSLCSGVIIGQVSTFKIETSGHFKGARPESSLGRRYKCFRTQVQMFKTVTVFPSRSRSVNREAPADGESIGMSTPPKYGLCKLSVCASAPLITTNTYKVSLPSLYHRKQPKLYVPFSGQNQILQVECTEKCMN